MRVIIAGSRGIKSIRLVEEAVEESGFDVRTVICGCAPGVDTLGESWALDRAIPVEYYPADWEGLGDIAGKVRNEEMAVVADALIAVWDGRSPGTQHMIHAARRRHLPVYIKEITR